MCRAGSRTIGRGVFACVASGRDHWQRGDRATQTSWSDARPELYFYRSHAGREVDFVLKGPGGRLVGVEVKSAGSVRSDDLRGLEDFAEAAGRKFHRGVLLYGGDTSVAFGSRLHAVPIASLWRW
ncbi:MAG TPA: DUF4143 domain-containing protein [Planctomycetota bacterium]|nr:DUF4143 domain-containing protein [Planctomycetota bacterium]